MTDPMTPQRDVPREPTQAMIDAATTMHTEMIVHCRSGPDYPDIWRAMYDAAPAAAPAADLRITPFNNVEPPFAAAPAAPDADGPTPVAWHVPLMGAMHIVYGKRPDTAMPWEPLYSRATVEQQARELAAKDAMARAVDSVFAAWLDNDEPAIAAALGRLFAARDGVPDTADARTIAELSGATDRLIDRAERAERDLAAARAECERMRAALDTLADFAGRLRTMSDEELRAWHDAARAATKGDGNG